jgi:hypothetical protein
MQKREGESGKVVLRSVKILADSAQDSDANSALLCPDSALAVSNQPRIEASVRTNS